MTKESGGTGRWSVKKRVRKRELVASEKVVSMKLN